MHVTSYNQFKYLSTAVWFEKEQVVNQGHNHDMMSVILFHCFIVGDLSKIYFWLSITDRNI